MFLSSYNPVLWLTCRSREWKDHYHLRRVHQLNSQFWRSAPPPLFEVLDIKPRALHRLGKHCATKPRPQVLFFWGRLLVCILGRAWKAQAPISASQSASIIGKYLYTMLEFTESSGQLHPSRTHSSHSPSCFLQRLWKLSEEVLTIIPNVWSKNPFHR